jgi:hypothetical protein
MLEASTCSILMSMDQINKMVTNKTEDLLRKANCLYSENLRELMGATYKFAFYLPKGLL